MTFYRLAVVSCCIGIRGLIYKLNVCEHRKKKKNQCGWWDHWMKLIPQIKKKHSWNKLHINVYWTSRVIVLCEPTSPQGPFNLSGYKPTQILQSRSLPVLSHHPRAQRRGPDCMETNRWNYHQTLRNPRWHQRVHNVCFLTSTSNPAQTLWFLCPFGHRSSSIRSLPRSAIKNPPIDEQECRGPDMRWIQACTLCRKLHSGKCTHKRSVWTLCRVL